MSAHTKYDRLRTALDECNSTYAVYTSATVEAAYMLQALLDRPDDPFVRTNAMVVSAKVIRKRAWWLAASAAREAIAKEAA